MATEKEKKEAAAYYKKQLAKLKKRERGLAKMTKKAIADLKAGKITIEEFEKEFFSVPIDTQ